MAALAACLALLLIYILSDRSPGGQAAEVETPSPSPTVLPTPEPAPTPEPYDYSQPVPQSEPVDGESWFADAVFIGDSRIDGFKLYSGCPAGEFLDYTGITVFEVMDGKKVIRQGEEKISILDALALKEYGKVYISLGVNELGYYDPDGYAETYGQLIDAVREIQPGADIYVQSIVPVNTAKCEANDQPSYVTNETIAAYNGALYAMCTEKAAYLLRVDEALVDETGEPPRELSSDGVHFQKEGYVLWYQYLLEHTVPTNTP